jgi:hypothetical protein
VSKEDGIVVITKIVLCNKMAAKVHRPLKVIAFKIKGSWRQRHELSKQPQGLHIDVALLTETYIKPHEKFLIPNFHFHRTDPFRGRKGGTASADRKCIPHKKVDLPPLFSIETRIVRIPSGTTYSRL